MLKESAEKMARLHAADQEAVQRNRRLKPEGWSHARLVIEDVTLMRGEQITLHVRCHRR